MGLAPGKGQGKPGDAEGKRCSPAWPRCTRDLQPRPCIPVLLRPLPKTLLLRHGLPSSPHVCTHASRPAPTQCAEKAPAPGGLLLQGCYGDSFHLQVPTWQHSLSPGCLGGSGCCLALCWLTPHPQLFSFGSCDPHTPAHFVVLYKQMVSLDSRFPPWNTFRGFL